MSKRKRGLTRHTYTVIRRTEDLSDGYNYQYFRGQGQLVPLNRPKASIVTLDTVNRQEIEAELELHTRQDFPVIDGARYRNDDGRFVTIGRRFEPDFVMYKNTPFTTLGINHWENNGQNDYRRCYLGYTSAEEQLIAEGGFYEVHWDEVSDFETAVNGVEFMNTLVLDKVM